jgi:hypothetical protein
MADQTPVSREGSMGDKAREAAKDARQQTVAEKMMPSRGLLRLVIMMFINLVFCLVSLVTIAAGIWSTPHGRNALHKVAVQINGGLVAVPPAERGSVWRMKKLLHKLTLEMPGFLVGYHGDRAAMYADAEVISRDHPVAFRDGFAVFSHKSVAGVLTSADQPRGMYQPPPLPLRIGSFRSKFRTRALLLSRPAPENSSSS